jgi:hypothetical protein
MQYYQLFPNRKNEAKRCASGEIGNDGLILSPCCAPLRIEEPVVPLWTCKSYSTGNRHDPVGIHRSLEKIAERRNEGNVAIVVARHSIHKPFDTENDIGTDLIVVPDLATPDKSRMGSITEIDAV